MGIQVQLLVTILFAAVTAEPTWPRTCSVYSLALCGQGQPTRLLEERQISLSLCVTLSCPSSLSHVRCLCEAGHHVVIILPGSLAPSGESGDAKALQEKYAQ